MVNMPVSFLAHLVVFFGPLAAAGGDTLQTCSLLQVTSTTSKKDLKIVVITVPGRDESEERMKRLRPEIHALGFQMETVDGPNMKLYCPKVNDQAHSFAAGKELLLKEWHGRMPDLKSYKLHLYQMATLLGHMRAWQHIVDSGTDAVILEDDAQITSGALLDQVVKTAKQQSKNALLLDFRHCTISRPPHLTPTAWGLTGYWLDVKAAEMLLEHFPVDVPVDWGVNPTMNKHMRAACPVNCPVKEYGGEDFARGHSAAFACPGASWVQMGTHPVAAFLEQSRMAFLQSQAKVVQAVNES